MPRSSRRGCARPGTSWSRSINDVIGIARRIAEIEPDVIVIDLDNPNRDMLENMFQLSRAVKRPIAMFVDRSDRASIEAAVEAGVSAYVVDGLRQERVKPILDMAISRFNAFSRMARELEEARGELEDRKLVDRAKRHPDAVARPVGGRCLRAAAQDGDEPEPQDRRDRRQPGDGRRTARAGRGGLTMAREDHIHAGFMPLFDSAVLVAAKEIGFAAREGVELTLHRETSWANIRDRIAIGHFDVAHMLGPMPIACNLGLTPLASDTIVPFALGLGGNCVTVSNAVWTRLGGAWRRARSRPGRGRARR